MTETWNLSNACPQRTSFGSMIAFRCLVTLVLLKFGGQLDYVTAQDFTHVEQFGDSFIYFYNATYKNISDANAACKEQGARLLYIKTKAMQDFIDGVLQQWSSAAESVAMSSPLWANSSNKAAKNEAFWSGGETNANSLVVWGDESAATFNNNGTRNYKKNRCIMIYAFNFSKFLIGKWQSSACNQMLKYICEQKEWIAIYLLNNTIITDISTNISIIISLNMIEITTVDIEIAHKENKWNYSLDKNGTYPFLLNINSFEDVGNYTLKASNSAYNYTVLQHFFVFVPANISLTDYAMVVNETTPVSIMCSSDGYYQPTVTWSSFGQRQQQSSSYTVTSELHINNTALGDTGVYTCTAINYLNEIEWKVQKNFTLTVVPLDYVPHLTSSSPQITTQAKFNKKLVLSCQFQGKPQPQAVWKIDENIVNASDEAEPINIQTYHDNDTSTTSIITVYDAVILGPQAVVSCEAFNVLGSSSTTKFSLDLDYFNGYYYWFSNKKLSRSEAQSLCEQYGGNLLNILNYEMDQFVKTKLLEYRSHGIRNIYTGGMMSGGSFYWTNNVLFYNYSGRNTWQESNYSYENGVYCNWEHGRPKGNNDCLILAYNSNLYVWRDSSCDPARHYVCQFKAKPVEYLEFGSNSSCKESTVAIVWQDETKFNGTIRYSITIINLTTLETIRVYNFVENSSSNHKYKNTISQLQPNVEYSLEVKLFPKYWNFPILNTSISTNDKRNLSAESFSMSLSGNICVLTWSWPLGANILSGAQVLVTSNQHISLKKSMSTNFSETNHVVGIKEGIQSYNFSTKPNKQYMVKLQQTMCASDSLLQATGNCTTPVEAPTIIEAPNVENLTITVRAADEENGPISCYFIIANKSQSQQTLFTWNKLKSILLGTDNDWFCVAAVKRFEGTEKQVSLSISQNSSCDVFHVGVDNSLSESYTCENSAVLGHVKFTVTTTTPSISEVFVQSSDFVSISGKLLAVPMETTSVFETTAVYSSTHSRTIIPIGNPDPDLTGLIIGVSIGLLVVIALVIAVVLYWRQKHSKSKKTQDSTDAGYDFTLVERAKDYAIPVNNLPSVYKSFTKHVEETFQVQFSALKEKSELLSMDTNVGTRPEHRVRNRYKNIIPYDNTRVELQDLEDDSNYVNASFINGFHCEKRFIATQGPLDTTLGHFWQMIWEQNCSTIVMLANLHEKNKRKCSQYWPDGKETAKFGKFSVQLSMEESYGSYVIRSMVLSMDKSDYPSTSRLVTQYHFTTWPDHGVPATTTGLMRFCSTIEANQQNDKSFPIVVHCSAGVGRTGTYIGLDILKNQMRREGKIDVYQTVFNMRKQRTDMVQTLNQYILLHTLLYEIQLFGDTDFPSDEASKRAQDLQRIETEFGWLDNSEPVDASQDAAFAEENSVFNRDPEVLPYDRTLVRLLSSGDDHSSDYANFGYINASVIHEYNFNETTIVTQGPMSSTQNAFWRLILDHSVAAIIMLTDVEENSCDEYWIDVLDSALNVGHVTVTMTAKDESRPDTTIRKFQVEVQGVHKISVSHIQCNPWKAASNKETVNLLLDLIPQSRSLRRDSLPIVVHCKDGAGRSGVFCALSNLLDRCRIENRIDVFRTVKDLRNTRPLMVRTLEDYKLVYEAIASCFSDDSLYANL